MELSKEKVIKFLRDHPVVSISVADGDKPMASVVLTFTDDDFTKYFTTERTSYKARALLKNPKISWSRWEHHDILVQSDGIAEEVTNPEIDGVLDKLADSTKVIEEFWPPVLSIGDAEYVVFKITPTWLRAFDLKSLKITETKPPFVEFISEK